MTFKKFQEMETKSPFLIFQNSFSAGYFPMSPESLDQNSSNSIGIIIESSKCCENKNGKTKEMDN